MVQRSLVGFDIELGEQVLQKLEEAELPMSVACWVFTEDWGSYRLVIGTPLYDKSRNEATRRMAYALPGDLFMQVHVHLEGHRHKFIREMRKRYKGVRRRRLSGTVGDYFVEDGFIYFVR